MEVTLRQIASEVFLFKSIEEKEKFLFVLGALSSRLISLQKAAEVMGMDKDSFLALLDAANIDFFYLTEDDVAMEREW